MNQADGESFVTGRSPAAALTIARLGRIADNTMKWLKTS